MDERFVIHRYKATSHAMVVTGVALGGWFLVEYFAGNVFRWDLLIIMLIAAATKSGFLLYYRLRD